MRRTALESLPAHKRLTEHDIQALCTQFGISLDGEGGAAQHFVVEQKSGERLYVPLWEEVPTDEGAILLPIREHLEALIGETREEKAS